jgi:hypothetical protein
MNISLLQFDSNTCKQMMTKDPLEYIFINFIHDFVFNVCTL